MAQQPLPGSLPCLFCGQAFANTRSLTTHLDITHANWVNSLLTRLGLNCPDEYPIEEYRRALVEAFVLGDTALPTF